MSDQLETKFLNMMMVLVPLKVHATFKSFNTLAGALALGVFVCSQQKCMRLLSYMFDKHAGDGRTLQVIYSFSCKLKSIFYKYY